VRFLYFRYGHWTNDTYILLTVLKYIATGDIQSRIIVVVSSAFQQLSLWHSIDESSNVGPIQRAGTHDTRFYSSVQGAIPQFLCSKSGGCRPSQGGFRVVDSINVALLEQDRFVIWLVRPRRHQRDAFLPSWLRLQLGGPRGDSL
jgi:hypothetical protein